jgi:hypothetical protein
MKDLWVNVQVTASLKTCTNDRFYWGILGRNGGDKVSNVEASEKNNYGFMNIADPKTGPNTAAHEFGHLLGLSDRYFDGGNWNGSNNKVDRKTTPISNNEINDAGYNPNNNLMSNLTSTLTPMQLNIANGNAPAEQDYKNGRGILYKNGR